MAVPAGKGDCAVLATSQRPHDGFSKIEVYGQLNNGRAFRLKKRASAVCNQGSFGDCN
jgi:hypothetical protein